MRRCAVLAAAIFALHGCAVFERESFADRAGPSDGDGYLFHASHALDDDWLHLRLVSATDYSLAVFDGDVAIRAEARHSASGLARHLSLDPALCPEITWAWHASQVQDSADLLHKDGDDVAASIFLLFGDPGMLSDPRPVPTLRYVWTGDHLAPGTIIDNPYLKGTVKSLVVRSGPAAADRWQIERRNLNDDFAAAFGHLPDDRVHAIILFTDNDQTEEPAVGYYGWARAHCLVDGVSLEDEPGWE